MQAARIPDPDAAELDFSMLSHDDLVNIVLQRSEVLSDVRQPAAVIRNWEAGDPARLDSVVQDKGRVLAERAANVIREEFEALMPVLDAIRPKSIADIGCGYAFFDLYAYRRYASRLLLVDVEENERRHFGFDEEAAAYTSLEIAHKFLTANGVPTESVSTWNPEIEDPGETEKVDLAVSFLSCGFHFPVDMYMPFFRFGVVPGGSIILDLRGQAFQENRRTLMSLGKVEVLSKGGGRRRVLVRKGRAR
ncbi:MAG: class I SAM-dependent methyltransferase [Rhodobacter sp.]|nr:class I SAM-dependent methyltransferase [Rhodobacter sp.]